MNIYSAKNKVNTVPIAILELFHSLQKVVPNLTNITTKNVKNLDTSWIGTVSNHALMSLLFVNVVEANVKGIIESNFEHAFRRSLVAGT